MSLDLAEEWDIVSYQRNEHVEWGGQGIGGTGREATGYKGEHREGGRWGICRPGGRDCVLYHVASCVGQ